MFVMTFSHPSSCCIAHENLLVNQREAVPCKAYMVGWGLHNHIHGLL